MVSCPFSCKDDNFIFLYGQIKSFVCVSHVFSAHSFADGHLSWSHFLAIVNGTVNMDVQVSVVYC